MGRNDGKKSRVFDDSQGQTEESLELKHSRSVICDRLVRFKQFMTDQKDDMFQIEIRLKSVEEDFSDFDKIQTRLEFLDNEEKQYRLGTESEFYLAISQGKQLLFEAKNKVTANAFSQSMVASSGFQPLSAVTKLPDLGLPSFHGKFETWYSFIDIFNSVVDSRNDLSEIDKFLYLKICCKDDALKLIDSLQVKADNYTIALDLLQKRYENRRAIINHHVNNILFSLPNVSRENPVQLRKLLDCVHQHLSALRKLTLPVDSWDTLIIPIIIQKLDDSTKREWENKQTDQKLPTLKELTDFLTKKCFTLEATQSELFKTNQFGKSNRENQYYNHQKGKFTANQKCYSLTGKSREGKCCVCHEDHFIYRCPKFASLTVAEKYNEIRKNKLCSNCLRTGHLRNDCMSVGCKKCQFKHNTLLHKESNEDGSNGNIANHSQNSNQGARGDVPTTANAAPQVNMTTLACSQASPTMRVIDRKSEQLNDLEIVKTNSSEIMDTESRAQTVCTNLEANQVLLSTASILISDVSGVWHKANALLDSGSQSNLISETLSKKLKLNCEIINIPLAGINQMVTKIKYQTCAVIKSRFSSFQTQLSFLVLPSITEKLPLVAFDASSVNYPKNINLADDHFNKPKEIDLLLGAGIFYELLECEKIRLGKDMPVLQKTCLGWIFTGNIRQYNFKQKRQCNVATKISNRELNESLTKFWQVEELNGEKYLSKDEQCCENLFEQTTTRSSDGKFIVKYPFKENYEYQLGDSKTAALKRFNYLENRLSKNEDLRLKYIEFMREYESLGHMSLKHTLESDESKAIKSFFLPHTAVLRDSLTTSCRVVFDASAKSSTNISLNDLLLVGPTIQEDLYSILLRLRIRKYVLIADVKMMYRCILIHPEERNYQQILWRHDQEEPIKIYQLNTVTYGTSSAPYQATRCLQELANINREKYPRSSRIIEKSFYMDDLLLSIDTEAEAIEIYHELTEILLQARFELRKWSSNNEHILNYILKASNSSDDKFVLFHDEKEMKTLGISWDASKDILRYSVKLKIDEFNVTKRTVLSAIAHIFDPLGLIGPAIIKTKLLIQQLWQLKLDWDQEIPEPLKQNWLRFASQIHLLNEIEINRHVLMAYSQSIELFGFCDSSEKAYGACIYVGSIDSHGLKHINLLTAKSKVAPIKKQTLPRLELLAACILADLVSKVKHTLDINISKITYFTDSTIVLSWLKIEPCNLKTFVANRIAKIMEISNLEDWRHVKSQDNAADIISRGLDPGELIKNEIWFHGPNFLRTDYYSSNQQYLDINSLPEIKSNSIILKITEDEPLIENDTNIFDRYSTLRKLRNVIAYIFRFKNRTLNKLSVQSEMLNPEELSSALFSLIRVAQKESFKDEIAAIKQSKNVSNNSRILNLHPVLDAQEILRVGGRLSNATVDFDQQHPIILPYKHKLTDLIIKDFHLKHLHAGTQNLLSIIRLKFWPVKGKNAVKRVIKQCIRCYRTHPETAKFLMGSLPSSRVTPSRPFSNCGVDYAGPIYVKEGTLRRSKIVKAYICVFVCFSTRALHLELVIDLTTNSFLNAFKRLCSRRGKPTNVYSDNGLNFVGANNYFVELYNLLNDESHRKTIGSYAADEQIKWHFIPARSAHVGGLWEAAVKSTKFHLKRVLGNASLRFEEMYTLLVQIEACLNSRPLMPLSNDINDYLPLTPAHFLIGDSLASPPEENVKDLNISRLTRYQQLQHMYQHFWTRWSKEYLSSLQTRSKWKKDVTNAVKIGSLVVIVEDNTPPLLWTMARVTELHSGSDNIVRVVSVRLPSGNVVKRSLTKICVLPVSE